MENSTETNPIKKIREGFVVSNKMNKTVVVAVETIYKHPKYHKVMKTVKKYSAHDENNTCKIGDKVSMIETRPMSKTKRWRIEEILEGKK